MMSWVQVMVGQGIQPSGYHPLVDQLSAKELEGFMTSVERVVATCVDAMPAHDAFIQRHCVAPPVASMMA